MTKKLKEENCRKIAEWLEPEPHGPIKDERLHSSRMYMPYSPLGAWRWRITLNDWEPRDFYVEETANSLVLENMPYPRVYRDRGGWTCETDWRFFHNEELSSDRKTAICEAALKLISRIK